MQIGQPRRCFDAADERRGASADEAGKRAGHEITCHAEALQINGRKQRSTAGAGQGATRCPQRRRFRLVQRYDEAVVDQLPAGPRQGVAGEHRHEGRIVALAVDHDEHLTRAHRQAVRTFLDLLDALRRLDANRYHGHEPPLARNPRRVLYCVKLTGSHRARGLAERASPQDISSPPAGKSANPARARIVRTASRRQRHVDVEVRHEGCMRTTASICGADNPGQSRNWHPEVQEQASNGAPTAPCDGSPTVATPHPQWEPRPSGSGGRPDEHGVTRRHHQQQRHRVPDLGLVLTGGRRQVAAKAPSPASSSARTPGSGTALTTIRLSKPTVASAGSRRRTAKLKRG
jgi:hypothetical protein